MDRVLAGTELRDVGGGRVQDEAALGVQQEIPRGLSIEADPRFCGEPRPTVQGDHARAPAGPRSEEHTSELQSQSNLVCRLLLEKKKKKNNISASCTTTEQAQSRRERLL